MPPHIIFSQAYPSGPYSWDGLDGAFYSIRDNGYMDSELFFAFIKKLFIPHTRTVPGPKLLILDGHGSHLKTDVINLFLYIPLEETFREDQEELKKVEHNDGKTDSDVED